MNELRELDGKVREALYPGVTLAVRGGGLVPTHWVDAGRMIEIPYYTTDIGAWGSVEVLKPDWRWTEYDALPVPQIPSEVCVLLITGDDKVHVSYVQESEATGLAARALGRARCVVAWAKGAQR